MLAPTEIKIDGPDTVEVGATPPEYGPKVMAGARALTGPAASSSSPDWQLGADCEIERRLIATKAGACTLTDELRGVRGKRTITIQ